MRRRLADQHAHLLEPARRRLQCACEACAILFDNGKDGKFRRLPREVRFLADFRLADALWLSMSIPIKLAYFFRSTAAGQVVAHYPSPAGATEALLDEDAWLALTEENPILAKLQPDVEALLVNRVGPVPVYYLVPIDVCYELTGLLGVHWARLVRGHGNLEANRRLVRALSPGFRLLWGKRPWLISTSRWTMWRQPRIRCRPQLVFKLRITQIGKHPVAIHSINLHCQIRLEPAPPPLQAAGARKTIGPIRRAAALAANAQADAVDACRRQCRQLFGKHAR